MVSSASKPHSSVYTLAIDGISIALVFIATAFINIRLPITANGGLIHLGNVPLFLTAIIFGKKSGAAAGAFGMALFDVLSGWTIWAPFTFIIVGLMGYTVGKITEKDTHNTFFWYFIAVMSALVIKIIGYYIAEAILYNNWIIPVSSIPGNTIQVLTAGVITIPIAKPLKNQLKNIKRS